MQNGESKSKQILLLLTLTVALVLLCILGSYTTLHLLHKRVNWTRHDDQTQGHQWLHAELNLTQEQAAAVDAFESDYRMRRKELLQEFNSKIENLRQILVNSSEYNPEVEHAIHELHIIHGDLQELSIRHYFQMMSVLPPDKQEHLKQIATEALSIPE